MGLYKDAHELLNCNYSFLQGIDHKEQPQTDVQGGALHVTMPNLPSPQIMKWMLKPNSREDGCIVLCDADDTPLSKIFFKNAACVKLNINYMRKGNNYLATQMIIQPERIIFGTVTFSNDWTNNI